MKTMRAPRRFSAITRSFVALLALGAACADKDHTDVCLGPGCATYEGIAGKNSLTAGNFGGFGGADAGTAPDAAVPPDSGTPPPPDPCEVAFLSPLAGDGGGVTLAADDDVDGEACGQSFSARVLVLSNASQVNLFVNDNPLGSVPVSGGVARFDAALGNRGQLGNALRAEATMADGRHCSTLLGASVFVGCAGPSCSIDSPLANQDGFLNQTDDDDDNTAGLQTDIVVVTEIENAQTVVRLGLDADFDAVPDAVVEEDDAQGSATFPGVTLAEGPRTVRAECRDEFDVVTLSPIIEWNVDISACSLEIESIAGGTDPITAADDLDESPQNGLDVLVRGTIEGGDCDTLEIGECSDDPSDISLRGLLGSDGGFIVPIKVPAATASLALCARVKDSAGNPSAPDVELDVNVRADSPSVAIESPASGTRFNLDGTSGAIADLNPSSQGSCEIDVVVDCSDVGVGVDLLADGDVIATQPCVAQGGLAAPFSGRATFGGVSLASNDDGSTTTLSARQGAPGLPAGVSANVLVRADCDAPTCSFESPDPSTPFLNSSVDGDGAPGFQIDVVVATDSASAGQPIRLRFDGDPSGDVTEIAVAGSGSASATFATVTLSEGSHDARAFCSDAAGNVGETPLTSWTVDVTACTTNLLVAGGHDPIVPNDDLDEPLAGLQVSVAGQSSGTGCSAARVGLCGAMGGEFTDLADGGSFALSTTVPSSTATGVSVCAEVQDEAGNVFSQSASVNVRVDAPVVAFLAPAPAAAFNLGTGCTTAARVSCSDEGAPVELFRDGVSQGSALCTVGEASFPSVTLLTKNDGSTSELSAVQTAQGVASLPASVAVQADCEAPLLSFSAPTCNAQLALAGDDADTVAPGLQFDVNVINGGIPDVVLTVLAGSSTDVEATGDSTSTEFSAVDLGGPGNVSLVACATDPQGNQGCAPSCALTVTAEPSIAITDPRPPAVFTIEDDCDTRDPEGAGLQIVVAGTSSATNGSPVEITIGSGVPSTVLLASGSFTACVQAPDGEDQTLTATVTDTLTELSSTATVIVSTNTSPPPPIAAPSFVVTDRRVGTLDLTWSSVLDASGDPLAAYHLRCSRTNITTESIWSAASVFPVTISPALTAGVAETQGIASFRTGLSRFCMVRGQDAYGQLSPLSPLPGGPATVATVSNPFSTLAFSSVTPSTATRVSVSALGDINGDGIGDLIYGTQGNGAQVFFGGTLDPIVPDDRIPDVVITLPGAQTNHEFGANVAGLGDVNGDGLPDFAVTARALTQLTPSVSFGGSVFVFFGKPSSSAWPTTISVAANPGCGADLCFHSSETLAALGSSVTSTDFDGVSPADIVIGAQSRNSLVGRVYVILGGSQLNVGGSPPVISLPAGNPSGFIIDPTSASRNFGVGVAGVGVGSDTRGDLVISALGRSVTSPTPETVNGEAFFVAGRALATVGLTSIAAGPPFAVGTPNFFGSPMRAVGDVNNDGFGDVWVSTNFDANGVVPVYLGRSTGFIGASLFGFTNDLVDNEWASYVATGFHTALGRLGDIDNNGFDDVLVGSIFARETPGSADLFYSDSTTQNRTRSSADAQFSSAGNGRMTPSFVGDVTGDGFRDIATLDAIPAQTLESGEVIPSSTRLTLLY